MFAKSVVADQLDVIKTNRSTMDLSIGPQRLLHHKPISYKRTFPQISGEKILQQSVILHKHMFFLINSLQPGTK